MTSYQNVAQLVRHLFPPLALSIVVIFGTAAVAQYSCGQFDYSQQSNPDYKIDTQGHITGYHGGYLQGDAFCYYSGLPAQICDVNMEARGDLLSTDYEEGIITSWEHDPALGYFDGGANGPSPQTATEVTAFGVRSCYTPSCAFSISVGFPPATVNYNPAGSALWGYQDTEAFTCKQKTGAWCQPQKCPPRYEWNAAECACVYVGGSPIIIDTRGSGFHLSKPAKGTCAPFDLRGDGEKQCWSWPVVGSGNGWLALDRNGNGQIDSGKELFGNYTEMPVNTPDKNGYDALMQFALVQNGGHVNPDGSPNYILDERDKVWDRLRVWIPEDYSGVSKPRELHKLSEFGIRSIALIPAYYKKVDEWGNSFRWGAPLNIKASEARGWAEKNNSLLKTVTPHELDVQTYDVWLVNSEGK
jgi:hypothetical protein